jgi:hypothetical protein
VTIVSGGSGGTFPATVTFSVPPNTTQQQATRGVRVGIGTFVTSPRVEIAQNHRWPRTHRPAPRVRPSSSRLWCAIRDSAGASSRHEHREPTASWTATTSEPWLVVSPSSGISPSTAFITIDPAGAGCLLANARARQPRLAGRLQAKTLTVGFRITDASTATQTPFGFMDAPSQGARV